MAAKAGMSVDIGPQSPPPAGAGTRSPAVNVLVFLVYTICVYILYFVYNKYCTIIYYMVFCVYFNVGGMYSIPDATRRQHPTSKSEGRSTRMRGCSKGSSRARRATAVEPNLHSHHVQVRVLSLLRIQYYQCQDALVGKLCCHSTHWCCHHCCMQ